jgi:hypothetical protein
VENPEEEKTRSKFESSEEEEQPKSAVRKPNMEFIRIFDECASFDAIAG